MAGSDCASGVLCLRDALAEQLLARGASAKAVKLFIAVRGLGGEEPLSLRQADPSLSAEGVRYLVAGVEAQALPAVLSDQAFVARVTPHIESSLIELSREAPGHAEYLLCRLGADFRRIAGSPAALVRMADLFGVSHRLRVVRWMSRSKFKDDQRMQLAAPGDSKIVDKVAAVVPADMPEVCEPLLHLAHRISRGAGFVCAADLAEWFGRDAGIPLTAHEAEAFLRPFALHIGRHGGDECYTFQNFANEFLRKADALLDNAGAASFDGLKSFHERSNRSLFANRESKVPPSVLKAVLQASGLVVDGDVVRRQQRGAVEDVAGDGAALAQMQRVFERDHAMYGTSFGLVRAEFIAALQADGLCEATARRLLAGNEGFTSSKLHCRPVARL